MSLPPTHRHSEVNLWRQRSARRSFLWFIVCQSADTEAFLWAANMKVFLWCWLCYFQLKDGVRHSVYVFTCQWFIPFILAAIKGELFSWQTVKRVQDPDCLYSDWLLKNWLWSFFFLLLQVDLSTSAVGTVHSASECQHWIKPFLWFVMSSIFMSFFHLSLCLRLHRYHFLAALYITASGLRSTATCLTVGVCACECVCLPVCMLYVCSCPVSHQLMH